MPFVKLPTNFPIARSMCSTRFPSENCLLRKVHYVPPSAHHNWIGGWTEVSNIKGMRCAWGGAQFEAIATFDVASSVVSNAFQEKGLCRVGVLIRACAKSLVTSYELFVLSLEE